MPFVDRKNAKIFYETIGESGPWLTLINGHTRSSRDFRLLAIKLEKAGLRCLLVDNRGSGQTVSPAEFTLHDIAEDIQSIWLKLGITGSVVMGLSMGGMISQLLYQLEPNLILGLILVATGSSELMLSREALSPWGLTQEDIEKKLESYFSGEFKNRNKLLIEAMAKQIYTAIKQDAFEENALRQRLAMRSIDTTASLSDIRCPCLILHGKDDKIIPPVAGEALHQAIKGSQLKELNGIGHLILAEYSKHLPGEILDFFRKEGWLKA